MRLGERLPDGRRRGRALGVAEPARAHTVRDVVDDVVVLAIVRHTGRHVVELEIVAHLPCDVVVGAGGDRKSTRLNSSHPSISYAVFCLKKKNNTSDNQCYAITTSSYPL